jgi:hypothetical protein
MLFTAGITNNRSRSRDATIKAIPKVNRKTPINCNNAPESGVIGYATKIETNGEAKRKRPANKRS